MGRPSVRAERREQILDAFEMCVVEHGLAGATLARIAASAGIQPSAIAHFLGNREEVIDATLERSAGYYEALIRDLASRPLVEILDVLIGETGEDRAIDPSAMVLLDEMIAMAPHNARVREQVQHAFRSLDRLLGRKIRDEYPAAVASESRAVRRSLVALIDNVERLIALGAVTESARRDFRRAADSLVATLAE